jgi:hypothetical protein
MITVPIFINGNPILTRSAHQIETLKDDLRKYHCDDGTIIEHFRKDGTVVLAKKMLDTVKEK